jgi:3-isopropylmalate/(R)-2-methylmalate dehydratase small subunit
MKGKCWKFGDDVNTDEIIPARYLNVIDEAELATHCMEGIDEDFADKAESGDTMVGGKNFGCGSSREHAPVAIKAFGIQCVVARSFARIFFRNAINIGLPIVECPAAADEAQTGDVIEVNLSEGTVVNHTKETSYDFEPFPAELQAIIDAGGLIPHARQTAG